MAISARIPSTLDSYKFIPEIFSRQVLMAVKSMLVALPFVDHSWESELAKGDTIYITKTNIVTATEVTVGTEGVLKNPYNTSHATVSIDQYFEAPVVIDYMSRRQSQVDLVGNAAIESAYAVSRKMDSTICDLFEDLSDSTGYGTDGSAVTDDVLIDCVEELDNADIPAENRAWIVDPSVKADLMTIDKFVRADYFASDAIPTGAFRKDIYGAPMLITNNLTANSTGNFGAYLHKKAITAIVSENLGVDRVDQPLKHQVTINTTSLWGVAEIQDDWGCPLLTRLA